jgi:GNAT superfamily N-acetyltransferase
VDSIDALTPADLDAAVRLSTEAGWNQTAADWQRLLDLAPAGCHAGRVAGRLVATATAVDYRPDLSWIGMVLVAHSERRRGFGSAILARALEQVGARAAGLDATDLGRPLYLRLGFGEVTAIDRWVGILRPPPSAPDAVTLHPLDDRTLDEAINFDRRAAGADRSALLGHLAGEAGAVGWLARAGGVTAGLACLRPGREHWHLGPIVGPPEPFLRAAGDHLGPRTVLVDAPRRERTTALLEASSLRVERRLTRMTRPAPRGILSGELIVAATAFEWG